MALQTSYSLNQAAGFPGRRVDMSEWDASTKIATATIAYGAPVQRSGNKGCSPFANGGECIGIAAAKHAVTGNGDAYAQYDNVPLANEGVYDALADAAITAGAALNFNTATGRYTTASVSSTVLAVPGCEAETAASGVGALFQLRLRRIPS